MGTQQRNLVMNLSGVYEREEFWREWEMQKLDLRHISGTNCYCDREAAGKLREELKEFSYRGIHFLDSGNYHYLSLFWLEKIEKPFTLVVFDHHTDLQPPAFGGLLSCGGWIAEALDTLDHLKRVVLIGPGEEDFSQVAPSHKARISFLGRETLLEGQKEGRKLRQIWKDVEEKLAEEGCPLYLSIDKDVLAEEELVTNWSQGDMLLWELLEWISLIGDRAKSLGMEILGADVCGEDVLEASGHHMDNDRANRRLAEALKGLFA